MKKPRANRFIRDPHPLTLQDAGIVVLALVFSWSCVLLFWALFAPAL